MNDHPLRLIVSDIEGCIMPAARSFGSPEKLFSLANYCEAARHDQDLPSLVFCTGRQLPYAESIAQILGAFFPRFPSIVENGAFLYDIVNNEVFPNPALEPHIIKEFEAVRNEAARLIKKHNAKKEYGKEICISLNPPSDLTVEQLFEAVQESLFDWSGLLEITHSKSAVDITPKGVDKASGIRFLAEYTGIPVNEMLGIGDTRGDLSMLEIVGLPACPANASDEVREIAKFIANQPETSGTTEILRRFTPWR